MPFKPQIFYRLPLILLKIICDNPGQNQNFYVKRAKQNHSNFCKMMKLFISENLITREKTGRTFIIKPTQKAFAICKIIGEVEQIIPMKKL